MEGRIIQRDAEGRAKVSDPEDDDDIATKGYVDQSLSSFGGVPSGIITMWSGAIADIPLGWALCDGSNGTPDLRDRFIVGAGGSYNVGDTGGANSVTLDISQIPLHGHDGSTNSIGSHTHDTSPHVYSSSYRYFIASDDLVTAGFQVVDLDETTGVVFFSQHGRIDSLDLSMESAGDHSHSVSIGQLAGVSLTKIDLPIMLWPTS